MKCPESVEELEEIERMLPLCRKTLYEQAKARIESGAACSVSEAARQIGEEVGRNPESIRTRIREEGTGRGVQLSEMAGTSKHRPNNEQFRTSFTGENEWYTPVEYIEAARKVMGEIDLDPATSEFGQSRIKAINCYTKEENGLNRPWIGRIWLNPPYSQPDIMLFADKLIAEIEMGNVIEAIVLTHNYTDTAWFHNLALISNRICFTRGRVKYEKQNGTIAAPTQGATFFYFGKNNKFEEIFEKYGFIVKRI